MVTKKSSHARSVDFEVTEQTASAYEKYKVHVRS